MKGAAGDRTEARETETVSLFLFSYFTVTVNSNVQTPFSPPSQGRL